MRISATRSVSATTRWQAPIVLLRAKDLHPSHATVKGNHGINHGASLETGEFNGRGSYVEVPSAASVDLGNGNFSVCACLNQAEIGELCTPPTGS